MQNFDLLKQVAKINKPVLLKRGLSATIEEWLMSAEYIMGGADGIMIEVHNDPKNALSDGQQSLTPDQFDTLMNKVEAILDLESKVM